MQRLKLSTGTLLTWVSAVPIAWAQGDAEYYGPHMMWGGYYGLFFDPLMMIVFVIVALVALTMRSLANLIPSPGQAIGATLCFMIALTSGVSSELSAAEHAHDIEVGANRLDQAYSEFKHNHALVAIDLLLTPAESGDADAQFLLAEILWHKALSEREDGDQAAERAKLWAQQAASQHHAGGLLLYAKILRDECGVSTEASEVILDVIREAALLELTEAQAEFAWLHLDFGQATDEATQFAEQAAAQNDVLGQLAAGVLNAFPASWRDPQTLDMSKVIRAATYFGSAAEQGLVDAQVLYARMLADGTGVEQNAAEALKWFIVAGELGWAQLEEARAELAKQLTPSVVKEVQRQAALWIDEVVNDPKRPIGAAVVWCDKFRAGDKACRRAAIWEDKACLLPNLPVTPIEGFRQSEAYGACRAAMRDDQHRC